MLVFRETRKAEKAIETFHTGVLKFSTLCKLGAIARNSEDNEI